MQGEVTQATAIDMTKQQTSIVPVVTQAARAVCMGHIQCIHMTVAICRTSLVRYLLIMAQGYLVVFCVLSINTVTPGRCSGKREIRIRITIRISLLFFFYYQSCYIWKKILTIMNRTTKPLETFDKHTTHNEVQFPHIP